MDEQNLKLMEKRIALQIGETMALKTTLHVLLLIHPNRQLLLDSIAEATREMTKEFSKALQDTIKDPKSAATALESFVGVMDDIRTILTEDQASG